MTVGEEAKKRLEKTPDTRDPIELQREMQKDYEENVWNCADNFKKRTKTDFFVVVLTKKERLLENVIRNYFFARFSCPTPEWDQVVYKYHKKEDELQFLWVIPAKDICEDMLNNASLVPSEEEWLFLCIKGFYTGALLQLCKSLNDEKEAST